MKHNSKASELNQKFERMSLQKTITNQEKTEEILVKVVQKLQKQLKPGIWKR